MSSSVIRCDESSSPGDADSSKRDCFGNGDFEVWDVLERRGAPFWTPGTIVGVAWTRGHPELALAPANSALSGPLSSVVIGRTGIQHGWGMRAVRLTAHTETGNIRRGTT